MFRPVKEKTTASDSKDGMQQKWWGQNDSRLTAASVSA
jgi:hypothetical protein